MNYSKERQIEWRPVEKLVQEGSIIGILILEVADLRVRLRPELIFDQTLTHLWSSKSKVYIELDKEDISKVSDLSSKSSDQLPLHKYNERFGRQHFEKKLIRYLKGLLKPPQLNFLEWVYEVELDPADPEREMEVVRAVNEKVAILPHWIDRESLVLFHGLDDGIKRTYEEVGRLKGSTRHVIDQSLRRARSQIKDSWGEDLKGYLTLSRESFGRGV